MSAVEVGCRVLRGPDWNWGRQDGGDGHVGTVVEVGGTNSVSTPDKTVVVLWDTGNKTNYRVGYQNAYDLRVYDTAPTGVKHLGTVCVGCREQGIRGIRWRCSVCPEHDLCTPCYMSDKHDINHPFFRFERPGWPSREMPRRRDSDRLQVRGIFVGAKVVRGADWEWGDQDGNKPGRVTEVHGWESESSRSVAAVTWVTGISNVYRLGHQGKVDLMYAPHGDVAGGLQYVDHLPVLGKPPDPPATSSSSPVESSTGTTVVSLSPVGGATIAAAAAARTAAGGRVSRVFAVGDRVKVSRDVTVLQGLQEGHGGWNPRMTEYVGRPGVVHRITDRGDIRVQYTNNVRWTVNPAALVKINPISVGDPVKVIDDAVKVKLLQRGHGEWIETMRACLGKAGQITKIYSDGDLRVNIDGQTWTLNRQCVTSVTGNSAADVNTMRQRGERDEQPGPLASFISGILDQRQECSLVERMVREAAQGRVDKLRELVDKHPDKIDGRSNGRVALQLCCHQGHIDCVRLLLHHQADISAVDEDGDTPLHYAAFGNQAAVMELLISSGCCVDALNKSHCTALHVSVNKQHAACVRVLVNADSDPNIQDSYGDTALHDAIGKENMEIIDLLASVAAIDFKLKNKRGFNTLHHAALKGNVFAVERILSGTRQVVDIRKDDGFTALHLSCLNGHGAVVERLVEQGQCNVDVLNNRRQTPLLLAAAQLHVGIVEYLVGRGASINLADDDGDTCLHLVSAKSASSTTTASSCDLRAAESPLVHGIQSHLKAQGTDVNGVQALACYLAQEGAALDAVNRKLRTPLDLTPGGGDGNFNQLLRWYSKQRSVSESLQLPSLADLRRSSPSPPGDQQNGDSGDRVTGNGDCTAAINGLAQRTASKLKLDNGEESCMICCDLAVSVEFEPCGHRVTCSVCCARMKKCIRCQSAITAKRSTDGSTVVRPRAASSERLRLLETKIAEIEEVHGCSICLERRRNVVFLCGHGACAVCAHSLQNCHMCRKPITQKINIY